MTMTDFKATRTDYRDDEENPTREVDEGEDSTGDGDDGEDSMGDGGDGQDSIVDDDYADDSTRDGDDGEISTRGGEIEPAPEMPSHNMKVLAPKFYTIQEQNFNKYHMCSVSSMAGETLCQDTQNFQSPCLLSPLLPTEGSIMQSLMATSIREPGLEVVVETSEQDEEFTSVGKDHNMFGDKNPVGEVSHVGKKNETNPVDEILEEVIPMGDNENNPVDEILEEVIPMEDNENNPVDEILEEVIPMEDNENNPVDEILEEAIPIGNNENNPVDQILEKVIMMGNNEMNSVDEELEGVIPTDEKNPVDEILEEVILLRRNNEKIPGDEMPNNFSKTTNILAQRTLTKRQAKSLLFLQKHSRKPRSAQSDSETFVNNNVAQNPVQIQVMKAVVQDLPSLISVCNKLKLNHHLTCKAYERSLQQNLPFAPFVIILSANGGVEYKEYRTRPVASARPVSRRQERRENKKRVFQCEDCGSCKVRSVPAEEACSATTPSVPRVTAPSSSFTHVNSQRLQASTTFLPRPGPRFPGTRFQWARLQVPPPRFVVPRGPMMQLPRGPPSLRGPNSRQRYHPY